MAGIMPLLDEVSQITENFGDYTQMTLEVNKTYFQACVIVILIHTFFFSALCKLSHSYILVSSTRSINHLGQGFSATNIWARKFFAVGAVLCTAECFPAPPASTRHTPVTPPVVIKIVFEHCPNVPWGKAQLFSKH